MRREDARVLWLVAAGVVVLAVVKRVLGGDVAGYAQDAVSAAAVVALWVGLYRNRQSPRAWACIGLGVTLWLAGDLVWDGYALAGVERPDVSFADFFYLVGYPLLACGLYEMARVRSGRHAREGLLDGLIFGAAALVAVWQLLVVPTAAGTHHFLTGVVWSAYPLGDVLLIAGAVWLAISPGRRGLTTCLLLGALVATFVLDVLYQYLPLNSSFDVARLDWFYPMTYLMLAAAALHRDGSELTTPGPATTRLHPARLLLLGASLVAIPSVAILTDARGVTTRAVLLATAISVSAAVVARFTMAVRARESAQNTLAYRATHDTLTGAVNRVLLLDRVEHALARDRRDPLAVMYLDLDKFKSINDTLGHEGGDVLLLEATRRIEGVLRPSDTLGRFGGDEFVLLCEDIDPDHAVRVAERVARTMAAPFEVDGRTVSTTISIGVAIGDDRTPSVDALIRSADQAMYEAKRLGGNCVEVYDEELRARHQRRREIEEALAHAIERSELTLHYQPVVATDDELVAGFEALLRWRRPDGSMIPPGEFIPIAEETGLIVPIGDWIIREACGQLEAWSYDGIDEHWISINVSALQLRHDNLRRSLGEAVAGMGTDPSRLMIELTESAMVSPGTTNIDQLQQLRDLGVRVAVDDFGTGYSGLAYLRRLPVDVIKIDQTFVAELLEDPAAIAVVLAIVRLAHALDLEVIAEGAESAAQVEMLRGLGCDHIQGFFYAAAVPAEDATSIIRRGLPGTDEPADAPAATSTRARG
jgi:diguanylate cyclase (GGDEF)-like protein